MTRRLKILHVEWLVTHRSRMARLRMTRAAEKTCRQCKKPAAIDPKTGRVLSMCDDHLAEDRARVARRASRARKAKQR